MKLNWVFLPLLFAVNTSAFAATYYLDPSGSDSASGGQTAPWKTLSSACGKVASGDTIYLNPGNYVDPNRCNLKIGVKIQGAGKSLVTITSQYVGSISDAYIFRNSPSTIPVTHGNNEISGFTLDGNNKSLNAGIRFVGTDALSIHDIKFQFIKLHAILIGGWDGWPNYDTATTTPPAAYGLNVVIHDIETNDTTQDDYSGSLPGAIHLQALQGAQVYNLSINENYPSRGVGVKAVPGWLHSLNGTNWNIKTNLANGDAFVFEMYNFEGDSEIHHSNFNHAISLNGGPLTPRSGSSWNLRIHDTMTDFTGLTQGTVGHELSHNHLEFYNNFISNNKGGCAGLWTTNYLTATSVTNWRFRNNVLYNCGDGLLISRGSLSGISIVNNVFDTVTAIPWGGYGVEAAGGSASGMRIQNNACLRCASGLARIGSGFSNTIMDHNWVGTTNPGFAASGVRPSPYYQPVSVAGSQLIDKGINVGLPYSGAAPDIGAFEYNPVIPPSAFAITANAGANGSILPSGIVSVASGSSKPFTITPNEGYYVQSVLVDGTEVASDIPGGAPYTHTLSNVISDHTISAVFDIRYFHIVGSAGTGGTVSVADLWIPYNSSQTVLIVPSSGYQIQDVKVDGTSIGAVASYTFSNIKADHTIAAVFAIAAPPAYTISAVAGSNGSISPSGNIAVAGGQSRAFSIMPSTGYYVASVTVDSVVVVSNIPEGGTTYTFANVTGNHSISANFLMRSYHIVSAAGTGGSVSPADVWIPYNSSQTVSIVPSAGYQVQDVKVDGVSVGAVKSFTFSNVAANHTLSAAFSQTPPPVQNYTITASAGAYGSITPSGSITVAAGGSKIFTITPSRRYRVSAVLVDGVSVGAVTSYTFRNVLANHRIEARFIRR